MIPGHTKFLCDGYFGNIKQKYKYAKINTIENIEDIVNNSAKANHALLFKKEPDWRKLSSTPSNNEVSSL